MGLHRRKLMSEYCDSFCQPCSSGCTDCQSNCSFSYIPQSPYPPSPPEPGLPPPTVLKKPHSEHHKISTYLIISLALVAGVFLVVCCYALYARFFSGGNRSRRRVPSQQRTEDTPDDFLDEEHGPVVDHPIWYIRTTGLQQSIISAITVFKYKKGEGLIEGTECSVCLSEFQEDENLRLLPKCNHAFHLPCIDTWLRSHTNCPMCRAPIVTNPARIPSLELNVVDSSSMENTQMEILENGVESSGRMENSAVELRNGGDEGGQLEVEDERRVPETESSGAEVVNIQPRRSVSLDSSSAAKINIALATVLSAESDGNSNSHLVNEPIVSKSVTGNNENLLATAKGGSSSSSSSSSSSRTRSLQSAPSSMKRSRSYNGKNLLSWNSRGQKKPNPPVRSF